MTYLLANAEPSDSSLSSLTVIIIGVGIVVGVLVLGFVPVAIGWSRRHRYSEGIVVAAVVWGVLAAASVLSTVMAEMKWSREQTLRINSGYYDPNDATADAPQYPWISWAALAAVYLVLIAWALSTPRGPAASESSRSQ